MINPANDPVLTVRRRSATSSLFRVKTLSGWTLLQRDFLDATHAYHVEDHLVADWPVVPLTEFTRILGHPAPADSDRCPSCEHSLSRYHNETGCDFQLRTPRRNRGYHCACGHAHNSAAPVPVEDTDTPECGAKDGDLGYTCTAPAGHDGPWHEDENADGRAWIIVTPDCKCGNPSNPNINHAPHGSNGFCTAPPTVDGSIHDRIVTALNAAGCNLSLRTLDKLAAAVIAALPELAEQPQLPHVNARVEVTFSSGHRALGHVTGHHWPTPNLPLARIRLDDGHTFLLRPSNLKVIL